MPLALLCALPLVSCRKEAVSVRESPPPAVLARSGSEILTEADFLAEAKRRGVGEDAKQREALLTEMTGQLRLLAYAREHGFENDPAVKRSHETLLIAKAREALGASAEAPVKPPTEEELQASYNARRSEFTTPARVRVAMIQTKDRGIIDQAAAATLPPVEKGFGTLAMQWSEDQATRYVGGDFGDLIAGHTDGILPPEAAAAVFALQNPGDLSPVIESADGFRLFRLISKTPESTPSFNRVRSRILTELNRQRRRELEESAARRIAALPAESFPERLPR